MTVKYFKWTLFLKDAHSTALKDNQLVNHFSKTSQITTKQGLSHSLKNLIWFKNVDMNSIYPRCYDGTDEFDLEDFNTEFKVTKAVSILRTYVREIR